jgi:ubiquitin-conjugating enzyme E2 J1
VPALRCASRRLPARAPQPNGRFEVNTKICLSISTHHPEHWQPSWSLRTALVALTAFFPTKGDGAIGALDYTPEVRAQADAHVADVATVRGVRVC